jgi:hypothetical protein
VATPDDDDDPKWPKYLLLGVLVWIGLCLVLASRPLVDHVPTGMVDGKQTTEPIKCHAPLEASDAPVQSLPELAPPRVYAREACVSFHSQHRTLLEVDIVVALVGTAVLLRVMTRRRGRGEAVARPAAPEPITPR